MYTFDTNLHYVIQISSGFVVFCYALYFIFLLHVTGLWEGNTPVTSEFPAQRASNAENISFWWWHHALVPMTLEEVIPEYTGTYYRHQGSLFTWLTWIAEWMNSFNHNKVWIESISKFQLLYRLGFGMDNYFNPKCCWVCNYIFMTETKLKCKLFAYSSGFHIVFQWILNWTKCTCVCTWAVRVFAGLYDDLNMIFHCNKIHAFYIYISPISANEKSFIWK